MPWLKVYEWEKETWPGFDQCVPTVAEAEEAIRRVSLHFEIHAPKLIVRKQHNRRCRIRRSGRYRIDEGAIEVWSDSFNLAVILHEMAHHLAWCRYRDMRHGEIFRQCLADVYGWVDGYLMEIAERGGKDDQL